MNVSGWAVVSNNSGTEYREAKVQLIAGDPNVAMVRPVLMAAAARSAKLDGPCRSVMKHRRNLLPIIICILFLTG